MKASSNIGEYVTMPAPMHIAGQGAMHPIANPPTRKSATAAMNAGTWLRQHWPLASVLAAATAYACGLYVAGYSDLSEVSLAELTFYGSIAIAIATMEGVTSVRDYLLRQGVVVTLVIALCVIPAAVGLGTGWIWPRQALTACAGNIIAAVLAASMVFTAATLNVLHDALWALIVIYGWGGAADAIESYPVVMQPFIHAVAYPVDAIAIVSAGSMYAPFQASALLRLFTHLAVYNGLAFLFLSHGVPPFRRNAPRQVALPGRTSSSAAGP